MSASDVVEVFFTLPEWLENQKEVYDFSKNECIFCGIVRRDNTTGILPVVGNVWKCEECQPDYLLTRHEMGVV